MQAAPSAGPSRGEPSPLADPPIFHRLGLMCMLNYPQQDLRGKMSWALEKGLESWGKKIFAVLADVVENGFENRTLQAGSLPRRLLPLNSKV